MSKKLLVIFLLFSFNIASIQGIRGTISYFSDIEKSPTNLMAVKTLNLGLTVDKDIDASNFKKCEQVTAEADVFNTGDIDLLYGVKTETQGYLCEDLSVEATYLGANGEELFEGNLVDFTTRKDFLPGKWKFKVFVKNKSHYPRGKCNFDFIFKATEFGAKTGVGFWDKESFTNHIESINQGPDESLFGQLLINEVSIGTKGDLGDDFVEIYNPTDADINLGNFADSYIQLVKRERKGKKDRVLKSWEDTKHQTVKAYGFYLWASSYDKDFPKSIKADTKSKRYLSRNNGIALRLGEKNAGQIIDSLAWGKAQNAFLEGDTILNNPAYGHSLERGLSGFDSDNNFDDFVEKTQMTPNNRQGNGDLPIVINEFLADGDKYDEFVEIYNTTKKNKDITGWSLLIENNNGSTAKTITEETLAKKDWLAVSFGSDTILASSTITLFNADGKEMDKIKFKGANTKDKSVARIPDGTANWVDPIPTPGRANTMVENEKIDTSPPVILKEAERNEEPREEATTKSSSDDDGILRSTQDDNGEEATKGSSDDDGILRSTQDDNSVDGEEAPPVILNAAERNEESHEEATTKSSSVDDRILRSTQDDSDVDGEEAPPVILNAAERNEEPREEATTKSSSDDDGILRSTQDDNGEEATKGSSVDDGILRSTQDDSDVDGEEAPPVILNEAERNEEPHEEATTKSSSVDDRILRSTQDDNGVDGEEAPPVILNEAERNEEPREEVTTKSSSVDDRILRSTQDDNDVDSEEKGEVLKEKPVNDESVEAPKAKEDEPVVEPVKEEATVVEAE